MIELGETVTWQATHFGIKQRLTSKIVLFERPSYFRDSMQNGAFSRLDHDHFFEAIERGTLMRDIFDYDSPFWVLGYLADMFFLKEYMRKLLLGRNRMIKVVAESEEWKKFLPQ